MRILQIGFICLTMLFSACIRARPVYIEDEKKTVDAAVQQLIERFNNEQYEAIYNDANDLFKNVSSKEQVIPLMKATREQNGKILKVTGKLIKVVPGSQIQARAIYNFQCEKGERSMWFVYFMDINGNASLAQVQPYESYSDLSKFKGEETK